MLCRREAVYRFTCTHCAYKWDPKACISIYPLKIAIYSISVRVSTDLQYVMVFWISPSAQTVIKRFISVFLIEPPFQRRVCVCLGRAGEPPVKETPGDEYRRRSGAHPANHQAQQGLLLPVLRQGASVSSHYPLHWQHRAISLSTLHVVYSPRPPSPYTPPVLHTIAWWAAVSLVFTNDRPMSSFLYLQGRSTLIVPTFFSRRCPLACLTNYKSTWIHGYNLLPHVMLLLSVVVSIWCITF